MRGHTHALFGLTTLAVTNTLHPFIQPHLAEGIPVGSVICAGVALLGALAPDIDAEDSTIKRELGLAGKVTSQGLRLFGVKHRGLTHYGLTTLGVMAVSFIAGWRLGWPDVGLAFGLGYLSHVLADAMTKHGVPLWWPSSRRFHLLPRPLRVRTGGPAETLIFLAAAMILVWLLPDMIPPEWLKLIGKHAWRGQLQMNNEE